MMVRWISDVPEYRVPAGVNVPMRFGCVWLLIGVVRGGRGYSYSRKSSEKRHSRIS
jgi:hypothetical protein